MHNLILILKVPLKFCQNQVRSCWKIARTRFTGRVDGLQSLSKDHNFSKIILLLHAGDMHIYSLYRFPWSFVGLGSSCWEIASTRFTVILDSLTRVLFSPNLADVKFYENKIVMKWQNLLFTDAGKSCSSREFLTSQTCLLTLFPPPTPTPP